jgi:hypothetical protein
MSRVFLPRKWSYYLGEQRPINQIVSSYECFTTQQYMEVELQENTKFKLILWNSSDFSNPAIALCDYVVSGTAYGSSGTTYTGTETITKDQHQHQFNLASVLLPGEIVSSFVVYSVDTSACECPTYVDFSPYAPPTPTPTPTTSVTPTPQPTPTPTPTPAVSYYNVFNCNDPFGPTYVVKSVSGVINAGQAIKVVGNEIDCWEIIDETTGPETYTVSTIFADCATCQA